MVVILKRFSKLYVSGIRNIIYGTLTLTSHICADTSGYMVIKIVLLVRSHIDGTIKLHEELTIIYNHNMLGSIEHDGNIPIKGIVMI